MLRGLITYNRKQNKVRFTSYNEPLTYNCLFFPVKTMSNKQLHFVILIFL